MIFHFYSDHSSGRAVKLWIANGGKGWKRNMAKLSWVSPSSFRKQRILWKIHFAISAAFPNDNLTLRKWFTLPRGEWMNRSLSMFFFPFLVPNYWPTSRKPHGKGIRIAKNTHKPIEDSPWVLDLFCRSCFVNICELRPWKTALLYFWPANRFNDQLIFLWSTPFSWKYSIFAPNILLDSRQNTSLRPKGIFHLFCQVSPLFLS